MNTPNLQLALNGQSSKVKVGFIDSNMDAIYLASRLVKVGFKLAVLDLNGGFTKSIKYGVCDEKFRKPLKLIDRGIKRGLLLVSNDNLALKDCPLIFLSLIHI